MSDDNEGVADPGDDQDDGQDVHGQVVSGMVADLIGDRESHSGQHEMRQDFHAPLGEHEICDDDAYEAYDCNKIVDSLHSVGPTVSRRVRLSVEPSPSRHQPKSLKEQTIGGVKTGLPEPDRADLEAPGPAPIQAQASRSRALEGCALRPKPAPERPPSAASVFTYELVLDMGNAVDASIFAAGLQTAVRGPLQELRALPIMYSAPMRTRSRKKNSTNANTNSEMPVRS